ncbi:tubulin polyglutamylase TTLL11 [Sardina pilchardus]|uniref:tubulin polyglutamylase TTLL11 n=1 Tax=Sardina pilchardus TaxID=27697 RepID=UPI002E100D40
MSDHYVKVKVQLEQLKSTGEVGEVEAAEVEQVSTETPPASLSPVPAALEVRRDTAKTLGTARNRSKSRTKLGNANIKPDAPVLSHLDNAPSLRIKGTGKVLQEKAEANGNVVSSQTQNDTKSAQSKEDANKLPKKRRPVTVDTSKAKTSLEALKLSIRQLKWKEFPTGRRAACDIYWHGVSFHDNENIVSGQVNKFPGMVEMLRKINLSRAVRTMQELFPEEYNFYPRSWILPEEYQIFATQIRLAKECDSSSPRPTFIVKPDSGSQGDGIYLIRDPSDLRSVATGGLGGGSGAVRQAVVQEYMQRPLLIDKLKFDVRLYVLVRSLEPLEIYVAKEGLSRFCTEPYQEPSAKNLHRVFMHLTNYSLNVQSGNFVHSDSRSTGSKRTFSSVLGRLASKGADVKRVWSDIIALVIKTVIALVPELKVFYQADIPPGRPGPTCFQILGFDILLMKNLKPVLLEVNSNPSMRIEHEQEVAPGVFEYVPSPVDEEVKVGVIRDTLRLMDPLKKQHTTVAEQEEILVEAGSVEKACPAGEELALPSLCLKQVFPKYTKQFSHLRSVDRIASLFLRFLGVKGTMRMGPTGFRTFIRNCKLSNSSLSMASVDILYIDITRRWAGMLPDSREAGMTLQAFVEAFFYLAGRRFKSLPLREQVLSLLEQCESALQGPGGQDDNKPRPPRLSHAPSINPAAIKTNSPAPARRSHDYRLHQTLRPTAKGNTEH